jgi:hypothetical protein
LEEYLLFLKYTILVNYFIKGWGNMGNTSYRYVINAVGKCGETYLTHCQDKNELKTWISEHEEKLLMNELRVLDKKQHPFLKLFSLKR